MGAALAGEPADAAAQAPVISSASRKMKNATRIDSASWTSAPATVMPDASASLRAGSMYFRSSAITAAVSCAMPAQ